MSNLIQTKVSISIELCGCDVCTFEHGIERTSVDAVVTITVNVKTGAVTSDAEDVRHNLNLSACMVQRLGIEVAPIEQLS